MKNPNNIGKRIARSNRERAERKRPPVTVEGDGRITTKDVTPGPMEPRPLTLKKSLTSVKGSTSLAARPRLQRQRKRALIRDPRARAFIRFYLAGPPGIRGVGSRAYIAAGYTTNLASAESASSNLLSRPDIKDEIAGADRLAGIEAVRVLRELAVVAFSDLRHFLEWDENGVRLRPSKDLGPEGAALAEITEITEETEEAGGIGEFPSKRVTRRYKIKTHDKMAALRELSRHFGIVKGGDGGKGESDNQTIYNLTQVLVQHWGENHDVPRPVGSGPTNTELSEG